MALYVTIKLIRAVSPPCPLVIDETRGDPSRVDGKVGRGSHAGKLSYRLVACGQRSETQLEREDIEGDGSLPGSLGKPGGTLKGKGGRRDREGMSLWPADG